MAYNTKAIKTDKDGNPISQYYNPNTDEYEPVQGAGGGNAVILYNEDGTPNNSLSLGEILDKLDQLKGTVIDEETRKQNEQIRQQNEQQRIDLYNALKDLDVSQYELRLQNVENQINIDNFLLEEWDEPVISLPSNATNGQINEIKIFGNTEAEDNVKSTVGAIRVKSVGKNLFNWRRQVLKEKNITYEEHKGRRCWVFVAGSEAPKMRIMKGEFAENTQYTITGYAKAKPAANLTIVYTDGDREAFIIGSNVTDDFIPIRKTSKMNKTIDYITSTWHSNQKVYIDIDTFQVEKGDTATEYEPYKESIAYVVAKDKDNKIVNLRSLPNGVADEIRPSANGRYELVKRTKEIILSSDDVIGIDKWNNINVAKLRILDDANTTGWNNFTITKDVVLEGYEQTSFEDNESKINKFFTSDTKNVKVIVAKNTTLEQARQQLAGLKLIYQLAEPEIIPIEVFGNLQSYENGTVYVDTIVPRVDFYTSEGIVLAENDVPIKEIDSLYLVNKENGLLTPLDISKAFIFPDGKGFTHPDLFTGALVDWDYVPDVESTNLAISMKLPTNLKASINSNIKKIGELSDKVDNLNIRMVAAHKNIQDLQNESNEHKEEFNEHKEEFNRYKQIYVPSNIVSRPMRYIAHRGASAIAPENTIPAYELAGQLGFWGVETDAIVTKDGVWVAHHDTNVERMTNGSGNIQEMTFAEVQNLKIDAGANVNYYPDQKIPTIEEFLDICIKWELVPIIEVKGNMDIENAQSLIELIQSKGLIGKVIISSLQLSHLTTIREINKEVFVEYATFFDSSTIDIIKSLGNAMLSLPYRNVDESVARQCAQNNIILSSYTINDYNIAKSFEQLGISQIYTDILC